MEAKHTPGPWSAQRLAERWGAFCINGKDGIRIVSCMLNNKRTRQEKRANAMLIAAAPDLLEALKCAHSELHSQQDGIMESFTYAHVIKTIDAAIAKATGGNHD